ncbi:MAG: ATP-binding protein [Candidatus Lindowbacteria bacterium]|nr:ATP-binding protein [Candidatus Lindowbacteria bacterium]
MTNRTSVLDIKKEEIPLEIVNTKIFVIAGGPCSGKTTLLEGLKRAGYRIEYETAEQLIKRGLQVGSTVEELRADVVKWQTLVFKEDFLLFSSFESAALVFVDTSFIETYVFTKLSGIQMGPHIDAWLRKFRFGGVFFLDKLERHEQTSIRIEDEETAEDLSRSILGAYQDFGYTPEIIPPVSVDERIKLILKTVENTL